MPGSRLAINLTGVHPDELRRGMVIARPGSLQPTTMIDVRLRLVRGEAGQPPLRHSQPVDFFSGAAEVPGRVRLLDVEQLAHGRSGWVQLRPRRARGAGPWRPFHHPPGVAQPDLGRRERGESAPTPAVAALSGRCASPSWRPWRAARRTIWSCTRSQSREPAPLKVVIEASGLDMATAESRIGQDVRKRAI